MAKFSAGQMVVCIDASATDLNLACGEHYEVMYSDNDDCGMVKIAGSHWNTDRFKHIPQTIKKESKMIAHKVPHIHAELIKLWADGAEIECNCADGSEGWEETISPSWNVDTKYRVKLVQSKQVFPETTLSREELYEAYNSFDGYIEESLIVTANAAIKHFIVNGDMQKYIESLK